MTRLIHYANGKRYRLNNTNQERTCHLGQPSDQPLHFLTTTMFAQCQRTGLKPLHLRGKPSVMPEFKGKQNLTLPPKKEISVTFIYTSTPMSATCATSSERTNRITLTPTLSNSWRSFQLSHHFVLTGAIQQLMQYRFLFLVQTTITERHRRMICHKSVYRDMSRKLLIINRIITLTLPVSDHLIHCVAGGGGG